MPKTRLDVPGAEDPAAAGPPADPLSVVEARLVGDWIRPTVGTVAVGFEAPTIVSPDSEAGVRCTLIGLMPLVAARVARELEPLRMQARYLVTASAATRAEADRLIVALGFAAMGAGRPELEREGPPPELWAALGMPLRPALLVREVVELARPTPSIPVVREVRTDWSRSRTVTGRVLGPGSVAISAARIEVANHDLVTHSDHRGEFALAGVPAGPPVPTLIVTARGVRVTTPADAGTSEPLLIRLPLPET